MYISVYICFRVCMQEPKRNRTVKRSVCASWHQKVVYVEEKERGERHTCKERPASKQDVCKKFEIRRMLNKNEISKTLRYSAHDLRQANHFEKKRRVSKNAGGVSPKMKNAQSKLAPITWRGVTTNWKQERRTSWPRWHTTTGCLNIDETFK